MQTDTPPLIAELLDDSGQTLSGPETLPTQQPIEIPAGDFRVQVSGAGQLGQTYRTSLAPGEQRQLEVNLTDQRLGPEIRFDHLIRLVRSQPQNPSTSDRLSAGDRGGQRTNVWHPLLLDDDAVRLKQLIESGDSSSISIPRTAADSVGQSVWALLGDSVGFRRWTEVVQNDGNGYDKFDLRPLVVGQVERTTNRDESFAPDLDGDGIADIVIAARHQAWLIALSGRDLSPLWYAPRGNDLKTTNTAAGEVLSATLSVPIPCGDVNGDTVIDLITMFVDASDNGNRRWIEAVSGADGSTIWKVEMQSEWFTLAQGIETPYAFQWFVGSSLGSSSGGGGGWSNYEGIITRTWRYDTRRYGPHVYVPDSPRMVDGVIQCLAGTRLLSIDPVSGQLVSVDDTGTVPSLPVLWADVDGDGSADAILLEDLGKKNVSAGYPPTIARLPRISIVAWSPARDTRLWQRDLTARLPSRSHWSIDVPNWPVVADLNGDGASDLLVPNGTSDETKNSAGIPWGAVEAVDGRTGKPYWSRRIPNMDQWAEYLAVGPDVDGDGWREVFVASLWGEQYELFVDCRSGANGDLVWQANKVLRKPQWDSTDFFLDPLQWWNASDDGWPMLIVTARAKDHPASSIACLFSAGTGKLARTVRSPQEMIVGDADGDGLEDLALIQRPFSNTSRSAGGELTIYRGITSENWRRLGNPQTPAADFDGDGVRDVLMKMGFESLRATSGRSGDTLWDTRLSTQMGGDWVLASGTSPGLMHSEDFLVLRPNAPSVADLSGDGHPDLLVCLQRSMGGRFQPLVALSGATGRQLWTAELEVQNIDAVLALETCDLEGDGVTEVVLLAAMDWGYPRRGRWGNADSQLWIGVFDGRNGRVRWKHALSPPYGNGPTNSPYRFDRVWIETIYGDLNGDGVLDIVVPADSSVASGKQLELRALDGRQGQQLWANPLPRSDRFKTRFDSYRPA